MSPRPFRVQLYWDGRRAPLERLGDELWRFASALPALSAPMAALRPYSRAGDALPALAGAADARALLAQGEVRWRTGATERTSYKALLALGDLDAPTVRCELVTGLEPLGMEGVWVPNRLEVLVRGDAPDDVAGRDVLLATLHAAVQVFEPDWGFVGTEGDPVAPPPLFSRGAPVAAWVTFLARRWGAEALALDEPAGVYAVGDKGHLVVAHPERPAAGSRAQRAAVEAVASALRAAGITR